MDKYDCGVCPDYKEPNTGDAWCKKCDPGKFLKEGGIPEIDNLIYESQLNTIDYDYNLEWIPYDGFQDIKSIGEGGFANIYSATWLDGKPMGGTTKMRTKPIRIALKKLKNSKNMEAFINEVNYFKIIKIISFIACNNFFYLSLDQNTLLL